MQRVASRLTAALALGLLLLVGTAMPMLSRMTCLMSGHSELRIGQPQDCCPPEDPCGEEEVGATCCVFEQVMPVEERCVPASSALAVPAPAVGNAGMTPVISMAAETATRYLVDAGPPLSALDRLSRLRVLRV